MPFNAVQPRPWYYALMDYGAGLKSLQANPNRRSAHYQRQPPFRGSDRQIRGLILKTVLESPKLSLVDLVQVVGQPPERTHEIISALIREGFLEERGASLEIAADAG